MSKKFTKAPLSRQTLSRIRFLILDIDGVMTDGSITYASSGEEIKSFNVKDGAGLKYWGRVGLRAGIITGRASTVVERRAAELDIDFITMNAKLKLPAFEAMLKQAGVTPEETAMIGDDLPDLPIIKRVGLGVAVSDAVDEVKDAARYVTRKKGGRGAVREVVELVLKGQGLWDQILQRYI